MLQIAICDPNILHRNAFCDTLAKLLFDAADYSFSCFGNAEDLLARQDAAFFQLVFLEIHLDGPMNGLEAADRIRSLSPDTDIIFLTDAAEYVTEGYRYHAFDFLIKPVPLARLQDVVSRYLSERRKRPADFLNVTIGSHEISLCVSDRFRDALDEMLEGEEVLNRKENMVALTILFKSDFLQTPGILYMATRRLAWEDINLTEIISTMNELTFVIDREDSMKAYDVLESFFDEEL